jgi:hypothetical protein
LRKHGGISYEYAKAATIELGSIVITLELLDRNNKRNVVTVPLMEFASFEEGQGYAKCRFNRSQKKHLLRFTDEVMGLKSEIGKLENFSQFKLYNLLSETFGLQEVRIESKESLFRKLNIKRGGTYENWRYFKRDVLTKIQSGVNRTRMAFDFESNGSGTNWDQVVFRYLNKPQRILPISPTDALPLPALAGPALALPVPAPSPAPAPMPGLSDDELAWPEWAKTLKKKGFFTRTIKELMHKLENRQMELGYIGYVVKRVEEEFPTYSREKKANAMYGNLRDNTWLADYALHCQKASQGPAAATKTTPSAGYTKADIAYTEKEVGEQYAKLVELNPSLDWSKYWHTIIRSEAGLVEGTFEGQRVIFRSRPA